MGKNKVKLNICGISCSLISEDTEEYVLSLGQEVEASMESLIRQNPRVSLTLAAMITALNFCDSSHKSTASADNLRSQIKDYLEDSSRARLEADEARREIEKMKKEIQPFGHGWLKKSREKPPLPNLRKRPLSNVLLPNLLYKKVLFPILLSLLLHQNKKAL